MPTRVEAIFVFFCEPEPSPSYLETDRVIVLDKSKARKVLSFGVYFIFRFVSTFSRTCVSTQQRFHAADRTTVHKIPFFLGDSFALSLSLSLSLCAAVRESLSFSLSFEISHVRRSSTGKKRTNEHGVGGWGPSRRRI